jgi:hypothetical protein
MRTDLDQINSKLYKDEPAPTWDDASLSYLEYLEANNGKGVDPLSVEGQALQARYLNALRENCHPFDVLRKIALNPFSAPKDRIAASKAMLEYGAVKAPSRVEVTGLSGQALKVDAAQLSALTDVELQKLQELLAKAGGK